VQYSRAIRRFISANGRYPDSVEELESTNNIRFLRKRYKDPITGREFRILHMEDVAYLSRRPAAPVLGVGTAQRQQQAPAVASGNTGTNANIGGEKSELREEIASMPPCTPENISADYPCKSEATEALLALQESTANAPPPILNNGPIVGVASISKGQTIREFHGQNRYNRWLFVYNPSTDHRGILTTPDQPQLNRTAQTGAHGNGQETEQSANLKDPSSEEPNPQ
jgi:hypothetical protein